MEKYIKDIINQRYICYVEQIFMLFFSLIRLRPYFSHLSEFSFLSIVLTFLNFENFKNFFLSKNSKEILHQRTTKSIQKWNLFYINQKIKINNFE